LTGLAFGSFLNVVIHRGPTMWKLVDGDSRGNLFGPRSYCPACSAPIRYRDLIPLAGYALLGGKCAACSARISLRYPVVEIAGGVSAIVSIMLFGMTAAALAAFVFFLFLIALAVIDLETGYLPDMLTIPLIVLGLAANSFKLFTSSPVAAVLGAVVGYGVFRGLDFVFRRYRGIEGLGQGDAKLLAAFGAWFGLAALPLIVFIATAMALFGVLIAKVTGEKVARDTEIPFGPALAAAGALAMVVFGLGAPLLL